MVDHTIFIRHSYSYNQRIDHQSNVPSTVSQVYVVYVSDDFTIKSEENMLSEKEKKHVVHGKHEVREGWMLDPPPEFLQR